MPFRRSKVCRRLYQAKQVFFSDQQSEQTSMRLFRFQPLVFFCTLLCLVVGMSATGMSQQPPTKRSARDQNEYDLFRQRFIENKSARSGPIYGRMHSEVRIQDGKGLVEFLESVDEPDDIQKVVQSEGWQPFKGRVRNLLTNPDPMIRGFGAYWLYLLAGTEFKKDIAKLLEDKPNPPNPDLRSRLLHNVDRRFAAIVLGRMGAKEYAPRLIELLRSADGMDRIGAIQGLGSMRLKEHAKEIAKLIPDGATGLPKGAIQLPAESDAEATAIQLMAEEDVQNAAMQALAELDATEYTEKLVRLFASRDLPIKSEVQMTAGFTLVRLNEKKCIQDFAALLDNQLQKGDAAKALALLDAKEYTKTIAQLIDDGTAGIRSDALIALGILDAKEYRQQIAAHLLDDEEYVRAYAAVALLMMSDQSHANEIRDVIQEEWKIPELAWLGKDPAAHFRTRIDLHPVLAERQEQLTKRAFETWKQIDRSQKSRSDVCSYARSVQKIIGEFVAQ